MSTKACRKCGVEKPETLEFFGPHKAGRNGLTSRCRDCERERAAVLRARPDQKQRQQKWRDEHKPEVKAANAAYRAAGYNSTEHVRAWVAAHPERARKIARDSAARRRQQNPQPFRDAVRRHYRANRESILRRIGEKVSARYRTDIAFNLKVKTRARMRVTVKNGGKNGRRTESLLGYSFYELKAHIESLFKEGMTWQHVLSGEVHIDHKRPVCAFDVRDVDCDEFKACWALSNLQPLWAADNLRKQGKLDFQV